jgi:hypothetical protein
MVDRASSQRIWLAHLALIPVQSFAEEDFFESSRWWGKARDLNESIVSSWVS